MYHSDKSLNHNETSSTCKHFWFYNQKIVKDNYWAYHSYYQEAYLNSAIQEVLLAEENKIKSEDVSLLFQSDDGANSINGFNLWALFNFVQSLLNSGRIASDSFGIS